MSQRSNFNTVVQRAVWLWWIGLAWTTLATGGQISSAQPTFDPPRLIPSSSADWLPAPAYPVTPYTPVDLRLESTSPQPANSIFSEEVPLPPDMQSSESHWYSAPVLWLDTIPWDTAIELGLNGSTGSNETTSVRTGGYIKRKTPRSKTDVSAYYNKTSAGGVETQSNAQVDLRNDWLFAEYSRWSSFGKATMFYDEFQPFNLQVNANGGIGYRLLETETTELTARVGGGGSRDIGGVSTNQWTPEALVGYDLNHQIAENQKLFVKFDYFPEFEHPNEHRTVTDVGWEVELSRPSNLSLKISWTDRFDSTGGGADPRVMNYSALLLWKL